MTTWDDLPLSDVHTKMLVESGLTPEIAAARGYRTIGPGDLDTLRTLTPTPFGRRASHAGILVPTHGVTGGVVGHQLRPDADVIAPNGDVRKYLTPYGETGVIDCPPTMLAALGDTAVPLLVTEGAKKADAAAAAGHLCVDLRGVDNWTSRQGTALEDWRDIPLLGRRVAIAYDSDLATNPGVRGAGKRLARYLTRTRGAVVSFLLIPGYDDGRKRGLDDWFVDHPGADPWDLAADTLPEVVGDVDDGRVEVLATDLDVADEWVTRNVHAFRYGAEDQRWMGYRDGLWDREAGVTYARVAFQDMARDIRAYAVKIKDGDEQRVDQTPWLRESSRISAALTQAAANQEMVISVRDMDADPYLFNLGNGTWDLRRGILLDHDPGHLITLGTPVQYDPDAETPLFDTFLRFVLPDPDTRAFVQRLFGMAMIGDSRDKDHVFPVFQGDGRNGKGTLLRLVQAVFGTYYSGINKSLLVINKRDQHDTVLASLYKRRLVTAQEVGEDDTWNAAQIKELCGADNITARYMRDNEFTFTPSHTLMMAANNWPAVNAKDEAFWARVRKVPFVNTFPHGGDPTKEAALRGELPGILNWVIAGSQDYLRNGLGEPAAVAAATASSRASSDPLQTFLSEHVEVTHDPAHTVPFGELFDKYEHWHRDARVRSRRVGRNKFGVEIARTAGVEAPARHGLDRTTSFAGMRYSDGLGVTGGDDTSTEPGDVTSQDIESDNVRSAISRVTSMSPTPGEGVKPAGEGAGSAAGSGLRHRSDSTYSEKTPLTPGHDATCDTTHDQQNYGLPGNTAPLTPLTSLLLHSSNIKNKVADRKAGLPPSHPQPPDSGQPRQSSVSGVSGAGASNTESDIAYERAVPGAYRGAATEQIPDGVVVFDIESAAAGEVYTAGPEFVRLFGYQTGGELRVTDEVAVMLGLLRGAATLVGHNIMNFDLLPFVRHHGLDMHQMAADGRLYDTQLAEVLLNPPPDYVKPAQVPTLYKLDTLAQEKFGVGKSHDLAELVKRHGGNPKVDFDVIPTDDADYSAYCAADVDLTARLARTQRRRPEQADYLRREHRVAAIAAQVSLNGFKVDMELLGERLIEGQRRKAELRQRLIDQYAMPTTRKDGGPSTGLTDAGRLAIERAFGDLGVTLPRSPSGKGPSTGKTTMEAVTEAYADRPEVLDLAETVQDYNGVRTVYGSAWGALHADGRVHPTINMYQMTGRWSVTNPGMTVFGKRGGRHVEREIFIPDDGEVIIAADLSQVDSRAVAAWAQDPEYLRMFAPGMDLHAEVAFQMFGDRGRREDAKPLSHGYNYGLGYTKLAAQFGDDLAGTFLDTMAQRFPGLVQWKLDIKREAIDNGHALDNGWGRQLRITPGREHTQAPAAVGQSAARDIAMEGLLRLPRWVLPMLRVQVHDEIVLSVPEGRVDEVTGVLKDALSFPWRPFNGARGHSVAVNIEADTSKPGRSWGAVYAK